MTLSFNVTKHLFSPLLERPHKPEIFESPKVPVKGCPFQTQFPLVKHPKVYATSTESFDQNSNRDIYLGVLCPYRFISDN